MTVLRIGLLFFVLDQLSKLAVLNLLSKPLPVLPGIFHLTLVRNEGAAFGLLSGWTPFLIAAGALTVAGVVWVRVSLEHRAAGVRWAAGLILAGAAGNLADRLRFGHVVDFLDFRIWPVFNVADSCITVGMAILIWDLLSGGGRGNASRSA